MSKIKINFWKIFILGVLIFSCIWIPKLLKEKISYSEQSVKAKSSLVFEWVPIAHFSFSNLPCFDVEIEEKKFIAMLDLGFNCDASLSRELMPMIAEKSFFSDSSTLGWRGNKYRVKSFKIPKIKMGNITFYNPLLQEEDKLNREESIISYGKNPQKYPPATVKLGWKLFNNVVLFLDFSNSTIAISDSIETFEKYGCSLEKFIKVSMLVDRDLIELETMSSTGPLRCLLDTGFTYNCLNKNIPSNRSVKEVMEDEKNFIKIPMFRIGGKNFGTVVFRPIPLKLPFHIEAILGMEFLFKHQVVLDFKNREIYFSAACDTKQD